MNEHKILINLRVSRTPLFAGLIVGYFLGQAVKEHELVNAIKDLSKKASEKES